MSVQAQGYDKTIVDIAIAFLHDSDYGDLFGENIMYGNADEGVPFDEMPGVLVYKERTKIKQGPTGMDFITHTLFFRVIIDKRAYLDQGAWNESYDRKKIELMIEGNAAGTDQYDPSSIVGILRKNFTLNGYAVNQEIEIEYGGTANLLLDERTREAQIRMTVDRLQFTPNKQ